MAPEDLKALGLRVTEELFNQGDLAVVDEFLDPGYTEHVVTEEEAISVDQLMDRITALRRACPDLYAHTEAQVVEGDTLVQRLTVTATDAGGRTTVRVLDVSRVGPDGRFVERWTLDDPFTVLRELGRLTVGSTARDERVPVNRPPVADHPQGSSAPWTWVAVGAVCGLAWSAALRGYMVELVGSASAFTWSGTFGALLLPGAVTGGLLGWAEYLRRTGPPRGWRWLALAPLALAVAPMLLPGAVTTLARSGEGSGAIAVGLMGVVGGYALSGHGRRWPRALCGAAGAGFAAALVATVPGMTDPPLSLTDSRGAWAGVLAGSLYAVLALGCSIPHRTTEAAPTTR